MRSIMRSHKIAVSFTSLRSGHHSLVIGNLAMFVWIEVSQINFLWRNIPRYQQPISWYRGCNLVNLHFCLFLFVEFPLNRHFIHWSGSFPFRVDYLKSLVFFCLPRQNIIGFSNYVCTRMAGIMLWNPAFPQKKICEQRIIEKTTTFAGCV